MTGITTSDKRRLSLPIRELPCVIHDCTSPPLSEDEVGIWLSSSLMTQSRYAA
jgi:hypothetical protein